jgi:anti-anti-sigma factor
LEEDAMDGAVFSYDGEGLLRIGGEIDMATAPELKAALEKCAGDTITVDCTALTFMDSAGIRALLQPVRHGRSVRLINVPENIASVLEIMELSTTFGLPDGNGQRPRTPN